MSSTRRRPPTTRKRCSPVQRYDLVSARPWTTTTGSVGVITFDDIVDVIEEEAEEDIKALAA